MDPPPLRPLLSSPSPKHRPSISVSTHLFKLSAHQSLTSYNCLVWQPSSRSSESLLVHLIRTELKLTERLNRGQSSTRPSYSEGSPSSGYVQQQSRNALPDGCPGGSKLRLYAATESKSSCGGRLPHLCLLPLFPTLVPTPNQLYAMFCRTPNLLQSVNCK